MIAEVWAGILNANQNYLRYVSYLNPIIETNVTVDRLASFKKKYYDFAYIFRDKLSVMLGLSSEEAYKLHMDTLLIASATAVSCYKNPLIQQALQKISITPPKMDFYEDMRDFVLMRIKWSVREQ